MKSESMKRESMKLYEHSPFPNPRRVRVFMAEKGIDCERVEIDLPAGEHRGDDFKAKNPLAGVPVLELNDGTHISETQAICHYLEAIQPEPPLLGRDAKEKAVVEMWQRRIEQNLFERLATYFHLATPGLGELEPHRNQDHGEYCKAQALRMMELLDRELAAREFIAGEYSVADITALCALDFAQALELEWPASFANLNAWHERLSQRPSAAA